MGRDLFPLLLPFKFKFSVHFFYLIAFLLIKQMIMIMIMANSIGIVTPTITFVRCPPI